MSMEMTFLPLILLGAAVLLLSIFFYYVPFLLWISAKVSGVKKIKNRPIRTMYGFFATFVKSPNSESPVHR